MAFPFHRPRRLRENTVIRRMVRENHLSPDDFIYPMFVTFGKGVRKKISSMPGCFQFSVDEIVKEAEKVCKVGVPAIILDFKNDFASWVQEVFDERDLAEQLRLARSLERAHIAMLKHALKKLKSM